MECSSCEQPGVAQTVQVVVARHMEDMGWLQPIRQHYGQEAVVIYDKSPALHALPEAIALPNVGREAHA